MDFGRGRIGVYIYPKDHSPKHVHVKAPGAEAKFDFERSTWIDSDGFSKRALAKIAAFLTARRAYLEEQWHEYQG